MLGLILVVVLVLALLVVIPRWEFSGEGYRQDWSVYGLGLGLFLLLIVVVMLWASGTI